MDLRKEWQKLQEEKFIQSSIKKEDIMNAIYQESNSTISVLRKRLKAKMNWALFFLIGFGIAIMYYIDNIDLVILIGTFFVAYLMGYIGMWSQYRQMNKEIDFAQSSLDLMKKNDRLMSRALNVEKVFGIVFFPIAIIGGMLFSYIASGKTLSMAFEDSNFLMTTIITIIVLIPLMWWMSSKMNQYAYGELIARLKGNIQRLEDLD